jgi:hypothetical protein
MVIEIWGCQGDAAEDSESLERCTMSNGKQLPIFLQLFTGRQKKIYISYLIIALSKCYVIYKVYSNISCGCHLCPVCLSVCDLVSAPQFWGKCFNYTYYAVTNRRLAVHISIHIDPQKVSCGLMPRKCKDGSSEIWWISTGLHGVTTHMTMFFKFTIVLCSFQQHSW